MRLLRAWRGADGGAMQRRSRLGSSPDGRIGGPGHDHENLQRPFRAAASRRSARAARSPGVAPAPRRAAAATARNGRPSLAQGAALGPCRGPPAGPLSFGCRAAWREARTFGVPFALCGVHVPPAMRMPGEGIVARRDAHARPARRPAKRGPEIPACTPSFRCRWREYPAADALRQQQMPTSSPNVPKAFASPAV